MKALPLHAAPSQTFISSKLMLVTDYLEIAFYKC